MDLNIDEIDRHILHELQLDARRPNKALADAVGVSPSTMINRIRSLEERGAIRGYHADVDPRALNRSVQVSISVQLQPKTAATVAAFVDAMWALDETMSVSLLTGHFDAMIQLSVRDVAALSDILLSGIANAPGVVDEQTSIVFEHRRKAVLTPLDD